MANQIVLTTEQVEERTAKIATIMEIIQGYEQSELVDVLAEICEIITGVSEDGHDEDSLLKLLELALSLMNTNQLETAKELLLD